MGGRALRAPVGVPASVREMTAHDARAVVDACFHGSSDGRVGVECEWFVVATDDVRRLVPSSHVHATCEHVLAGPDPCRITFEPGGQLELSTQPASGIDAACRALARDMASIRTALARDGYGRVVDAPRYRAMERYFASAWPSGRTMMCSTAALQVNVDVGRHGRVVPRWRL